MIDDSEMLLFRKLSLPAGTTVTGPDDVLPRLLQAARRHLGMDVAFVSEFASGRREFRYVDAEEPAPIRAGRGDPMEDTVCQRVVDGRLPRLMVDAGEVPEARRLPVTLAMPIGAHLSVPIVLPDNRVYGTFCCFSYRRDDSLNTRDLDVVRMFAELTAECLTEALEANAERDRAHERIESALTHNGGLRTVYQPVIGLADGQLMGIEALSRFASPLQRTPDLWFAEAASVGMGVDLEIRAARQALPALSWLAPDAYLAMNLSPEAIVSGYLDSMLADVDVTRLVLEMTEHAEVTDYEKLQQALAPHRQRGLRVAVDDAGAGYSSFRHILRVQPEIIKLDLSITRGIHLDRARQALAGALIRFASDIGASIVAEGVENAEELLEMRRLGATAAQGYFLGRPSEYVGLGHSGGFRPS